MLDSSLKSWVMLKQEAVSSQEFVSWQCGIHQNAREAPAFMPGREKRVQRELHIGIRVDVIVNTG